jgi:hypothetical protein
MRTIYAYVLVAAAAAIALSVPAAAQKIPMWRMADGRYFKIPKCTAPAKLVEMRDAKGRVFWRCVAPR